MICSDSWLHCGVNIPGGGSAIGTTEVSRMKGDTHALLVFNPASVAGLLVAGKGAATVRDLTMTAQLALDEQFIIVNLSIALLAYRSPLIRMALKKAGYGEAALNVESL